MKVHLEHSPGEVKTNWNVEETSNNRKCYSSSPRGLETNVIRLRILLLCLLCLCYPSHVFLIFHIFSPPLFFYLFRLSWKTNWYLTNPGPSTHRVSEIGKLGNWVLLFLGFKRRFKFFIRYSSTAILFPQLWSAARNPDSFVSIFWDSVCSVGDWTI